MRMQKKRHTYANRKTIAESTVELLESIYPLSGRAGAIAHDLGFSIHTVRRWLDRTNKPDDDAVTAISTAFPEEWEARVWSPLRAISIEREINEIDRQSAALAQKREALAKRMESSGAGRDTRP